MQLICNLRGKLAYFLVCLLLLLGCASPAVATSGDRDANLTDFDFVTTKVRANYAGWETKTTGPRRGELESLTQNLRTQVANGDDAAFRNAMEAWVAWFDDGHLQLQWNGGTDAIPWRESPYPISERAARDRLEALGVQRAPVEGLWTIDDRYRLAILRRAGTISMFDAVVLSTTADGWKAGDIKAVLAARADGSYEVRYGAADKTELRLRGHLRGRAEVFDVGEYGIWRRVQDDPAQASAALRRWPSDNFELTRINMSTIYLRLPSFGDQHTETLRTLMMKNAELLSRTPNLIVDVRGNGGGSDFVYDPVLPYLYTRPLWRPGVEVRVSSDNMRLRSEIAKRIAAASSAASQVLASESKRMKTAKTTFIRREPPLQVIRLASVLPMPARVTVLVDRAGSSAENFIMDARQSRKVVLMGQENSAGVIDFGEMMSMEAPSKRFSLAWATTRSLRLPNDPVDQGGIAPDIRIPGDVDDPIAYVARWMAEVRP